jgi:hypothetical protein
MNLCPAHDVRKPWNVRDLEVSPNSKEDHNNDHFHHCFIVSPSWFMIRASSNSSIDQQCIRAMYATRARLVEAASRKKPTHIRDLQTGAISTMVEGPLPIVVVEYQQQRSYSHRGVDRCKQHRAIAPCPKRPTISDTYKKSSNGIIFTAWLLAVASSSVRHYASRDAQRGVKGSTPASVKSDSDWSTARTDQLNKLMGQVDELKKEKKELETKVQEAADRSLQQAEDKVGQLNRELEEWKKKVRTHEVERRSQAAEWDKYSEQVKTDRSMKDKEMAELTEKHDRSQKLVTERENDVRALESTREKLKEQLDQLQAQDASNVVKLESLNKEVDLLKQERDEALQQYGKLKIDVQAPFETNEEARSVLRKETEIATTTKLSAIFNTEKQQLAEEKKSLQQLLTSERERSSGLEKFSQKQERRLRTIGDKLADANLNARNDRANLVNQNALSLITIEKLEEAAMPRKKRAEKRDTYLKYHEIWDEFRNTAVAVERFNSDIKDFSQYWSSARESFETQDTLSRFRNQYADLNRAILDHLTTRFDEAKAVAATIQGFLGELQAVRDGLDPIGHRSRALTRQLHLEEPHLYDLSRRNLDLLIELPLQRLMWRIENMQSPRRTSYLGTLKRFKALYWHLREMFLLENLQQASDQDKTIYLVSKEGADVLAKRVNHDLSEERWKLMRANEELRSMTSLQFVLEQESGTLPADTTEKLNQDLGDLISKEVEHVFRILDKLHRRHQDNTVNATTPAVRRMLPRERMPQDYSSAPTTAVAIKKSLRVRAKRKAERAAAKAQAAQAAAIQPSKVEQDDVAAKESGIAADASPSTETSDSNAAVQANAGTGLSATPRFQKRAFPALKRLWPTNSPGNVREFSGCVGLSTADAQPSDTPSAFGDEAEGRRKDLSPRVEFTGLTNGTVTAVDLEPKMGISEEDGSGQSPDAASSKVVPEDGHSESDAALLEAESEVELTYQIPASTFSPAEPTSPLFWTHKLYKNPKGQSPVVFYCTSYETCERQAKLFLTEPVVGFDLEWESFASMKKHGPKQNVSLIQIASESKIGLFHVACFKGNTPEELMPPSLRALLESDSITKTGVNIVGDANRMRTFFDVEMKGLMELSHIYRLVKYADQEPHLVNFKLCSLALQVQDILTLPLKKDETRISRWSSKLNAQQTEYAAADAYAGFRLYHALEKLRLLMDPRPPRPAFYETSSPLVLPDGTKVYRSEKRATSSVKKISRAIAIDDASDSEEFFDALEIGDDGGADGSQSCDVDGSDASVSDSSEIVYPTLPTEHLEKPSEEEGNANRAQDTKVLPLRPKAGAVLPASPEVLSADSWAQTFLATDSSSSRRKSPRALQQKSVNASTLRAYHLWHEQHFDIGKVAEFCRQPPLALTTVATYIMTAIKQENLPFDVERAREVLKTLPGSIKYRYTSFVETRGGT